MTHKYIDPAAVASAAAWHGPVPNHGVMPTTPQPEFNLPRPTGLLKPGSNEPILTVAETPSNLRTSLFG